MRLKTKICLTVMLAACAVVCTAAGCKIGEMTGDEYLKNNNATDQCVTYYANGGKFNDNDKRTVMDVYYQADSYIMCPSTETEVNNFKISRTDYTFDAWYYVEVDGEGNLVTDANGNVVYGRKVSSSDKIEQGKHLYVAAHWNAKVAIEVYLVTDGFDVTDKDGKVYKSGDLLKTQSFGTASSYGLSESDAISAKDATYLYFFEDEQCTTPISTIAPPSDDATENVKVYVKYLQGEWSVVRTAADVRKMFTYSYEAANYYVFSQDGSGVINCASERAVSLSSDTFAINIEGNGVVIENLTFSKSPISSGEFAMFGKFGASSGIKNLKLKNVNVSAVVSNGNIGLYLVCLGAESGAALDNFVIEGANFNVQLSSSARILNIQAIDGVYESSNWLFGGFGTDDAFVREYVGIKINNAKLTINGATVVENISK